MSEHFEEVMLRYMSELVGTVARIADALEKPRAQHMDELVEAARKLRNRYGPTMSLQDLRELDAILSKIEGKK